jgi:hypothetical protein
VASALRVVATSSSQRKIESKDLASASTAPVMTRRFRSRRPRVRPRRTPRRKKPKHRAAAAPAVQNEHSDRDAPRQHAIAALKANPGVSLTRVAAMAKCSRSTVSNAARELGVEARKQARKPSEAAKPTTERRQRAQRFLRDTLADGPKPVTTVEAAASKAHVDSARAGSGARRPRRRRQSRQCGRGAGSRAGSAMCPKANTCSCR